MFGYFLHASHQQAIHAAEVSTRNLVSLIESRVSSDMARINGTLAFIAREMLPQQVQRLSTVERTAESSRLSQIVSNFPAIAGIYIFDQAGMLILSSSPYTEPFSIADRPHFQMLRDMPHVQNNFSEALIARATGKWSLVQSQAIRDESGQFLGVINALIHLDHFAHLFSSVNVGDGGLTLLRRSDNFNLILRTPRLNEKDFNQAIPPDNPIRQRIEAGDKSGTLTLNASTDGIKRLVSFIKLDQAPFYVQVAEAESHYLANWREQFFGLILVALTLVFIFSIAIYHLHRTEIRASHAAQQLADSETRFRRLSQTSPSGIWQTDTLGANTYVSERWCEITGISAEAARGDGWVQLLHPDDRERVLQEWSIATQRKHVSFQSEFRFIAADNRLIWVLCLAKPEIDELGELSGWIGTISDITKQVQMRQQLADNENLKSTILDSVPAEIAVLDRNGFIVATNAGWRAFSRNNNTDPKYASDHAFIGVNYLTACQNADGTLTDEMKAGFEGIRAVIDGRSTHFDFEYPCHTPTAKRWFTMSVTPLGGGDNGVVIAHTDISARKEAEIVLHENAAALQRSNQELEQFSYSISHDMRQPLRMISSYLQILQRSLGDSLDDEKREYLTYALDGAKRLDSMLLGLLEYSRVGRKGEPSIWLDSRAVLDEAMLFLRPLIAEAAAHIEIKGEWPRIPASPDEMLRLLQNLLANALKFRVADRAPQIILQGEVTQDLWHLSISDNGVGIQTDQINRLFQVFQRLQSRADYEGTGIGLALCRKIVEHHGGRIWAESDGIGLGSCFHVEISTAQEASV